MMPKRISFKIKSPYDFDHSTEPGVSGIDAEELLDPEWICIQQREIVIAIDYPLQSCFEFKCKSRSPKGWTRKALYKKICQLYSNIYANIDKYGVWGHGIGDLCLCQMKEDRRRNRWTLSIDS